MSGKGRRYGRPAEKDGPSLPLPPRELNLAQQDWVSSGAGHGPTPSRTPGSHGAGSNIETAHEQARAARRVATGSSAAQDPAHSAQRTELYSGGFVTFSASSSSCSWSTGG